MARRTTVLFPITDLPRDGAQRQLLELVKGLDKDRFRPIVLTLCGGGLLEPDLRRVPGAHLLHVPRKNRYDLFYVLKVSKILREMHVDIVQPFLTPATLFGLGAALLCRTPVKIVTERNGPETQAGGGRLLYLRAEERLARRADWAIANSQAGRDSLIRRGVSPSRARVIYNGINLDRLHPEGEVVERARQRMGAASGGVVVGIMARMYPPKNHALFLQAAALVKRKLPETRFVLLGDGPLRSQLQERSRECGLGLEAVFLGEQPDVANYLAAFDIAVLTSDAEGCSNSLLEAMALGKPVVATDVGGNREVVRHDETGLLVPPRDPEAFADALARLVENPALARSMGERGKQRVIRDFSLQSMVGQYQTLYQESIDNKISSRVPRRDVT